METPARLPGGRNSGTLYIRRLLCRNVRTVCTADLFGPLTPEPPRTPRMKILWTPLAIHAVYLRNYATDWGDGAMRAKALAILSAVAFLPSGQSLADTPGLRGPVPKDGTQIPALSKPVPYYAAFKVSAGPPPGAGAMSPVMKGPEARSFWKQIEIMVNLTTGVQSYSLVFQPTIEGVKLPPLTAIQVTKNEKSGDQVSIEMKGAVYSPWVPVGAGSKVSYTTYHVASASKDVTVFQEAGSVATSLASVGGWGVSQTLQLVLNEALKRFDKGVTNLAKIDIKTTLDQETYPFGGMFGGQNFTLLDTAGREIATVSIELVFRRTLRESPISPENNVYPDVTDTTLDSDPAYKVLTSTGGYNSVRSVMTENKSLHSLLTREGVTADEFSTGCRELFSSLVRNGFNSTDATVITVRLLENETKLRVRPDLQATLWTQCMASQRAIARALNIEVYAQADVPPVGRLNFDTVGDVALHILRQGKDPNVRARAASVLRGSLNYGDPDAKTRDEVLDALAKYTGYANLHCNSDAQKTEADGAIRRGAMTFLRRGDNGPDVVLALYGPRDAEPGEPAALVEVRAPTALEFNACERYELKKDPAVRMLPRKGTTS